MYHKKIVTSKGEIKLNMQQQ